MSESERANEASSAEQADESMVQANERAAERVAQFFFLSEFEWFEITPLCEVEREPGARNGVLTLAIAVMGEETN